MKFELKQHFQIEAARFLPFLEKSHPCSRMHGHSFRVSLTLVADLDPKIGWVIDYNEIHERMKPILAELDHRVLNEVPGLSNPTSELLAQWIYDKTITTLPMLRHISVAETANTECTYPVY